MKEIVSFPVLCLHWDREQIARLISLQWTFFMNEKEDTHPSETSSGLEGLNDWVFEEIAKFLTQDEVLQLGRYAALGGRHPRALSTVPIEQNAFCMNIFSA